MRRHAGRRRNCCLYNDLTPPFVQHHRARYDLKVLRRLLPLLAAFCLLALPSAGVGAQTSLQGTTISGGDLPYSVRLATADEEAFLLRINPPPVLEEKPSPVGASYFITSAYWEAALRQSEPDAQGVNSRAEYFPGDGLVRLADDRQDNWLVLNLKQRAIIDRYVRLAKERLIGPEPGAFDVLRAAALSEPVAVKIGDKQLDAEELRRFWTAASPVMLRRDFVRGTPTPPWPPRPGPTINWIVFTYPDGRSVEMIYVLATEILLDRFGTELYPVPSRWLQPVAPDLPIVGVNWASPAQIEEDEDRGTSPLWALMVAGGAACLGLGVWLSRRWAKT